MRGRREIKTRLNSIFVWILVALLLVAGMASSAADGPLHIVNASNITSEIEKGEPVIYDNVTIKGDLDVSKLDLPKGENEKKIVATAISITNSRIDGVVSFADFVFEGPVNFRNTKFGGDTYFWYTKFNGYTNFVGSEFNGTASFWNSEFNGTASFWNSRFNGYANFWGSKFNRSARFEYSRFDESASFGNSKFNGTASFWNSEFSKEANFNDVEFKGEVSFNNSRFGRDALFLDTSFRDTLYLTRTKYDKFYIRWASITELGYDDTAYLVLLENFKKLGFFEDADECYYQYRKEHRTRPWSGMLPAEVSFRKTVDLLSDVFYGYGVKPLNPLAWSIFFITLFGIFWRAIGPRKPKSVIDEYSSEEDWLHKKRSSLWNEIHMLLEALSFSFMIYLSGTKFFIDPPDIPETPRRFRLLIKGVFTLERLLGALFSVLFFLAIGRTIIR